MITWKEELCRRALRVPPLGVEVLVTDKLTRRMGAEDRGKDYT